MARTGWFETVAEAQRRAEKRLPRSVYSALLAGSERGISYDDNVAAFGELGFAPHVADLSANRDMSTHVMGQDISLPVIISPTGVQAVHPDGEVAVARAAAARGTAIGLSSFGSKPIEEVVAANPQTFFQMYWMGDRDTMVRRMDRARDAGAVGLIATLDWSFSHGRDWGSPSIPDKIDVRTMARFAPEVARRPRWLLDFARTRRPPRPERAQRGRPGRDAADVLRGVRRVDGHPAPVLEGRGVDARGVGRSLHGEGDLAGRRRPRRPRRRRHHAVGVQPRRQQHRRHPGADPGAARRSPRLSATTSRS